MEPLFSTIHVSGRVQWVCGEKEGVPPSDSYSVPAPSALSHRKRQDLPSEKDLSWLGVTSSKEGGWFLPQPTFHQVLPRLLIKRLYQIAS